MGLLSTLGGIAGNYFFPGVGGAIGSALGGAIEGDGGTAERAAGAANAGAQADIDLRRRMYEESVARQKPFYEAGVNALPGYLQGIQPGGELVRGFTQADYQADPGYAFRMSEGMNALNRSMAAKGLGISGANIKGALRFGQGLGSEEFQKAYERFRDTQGLRRNALAGVVGYAPTAAGAMTSSGQSYASGAGPQMYQQGVNTGNALITSQQARESSYGQLGSALGKYLNTTYGGGQAAFSQTPLGSSGFGTGLAYGNEDYGQYF